VLVLDTPWDNALSWKKHPKARPLLVMARSKWGKVSHLGGEAPIHLNRAQQQIHNSPSKRELRINAVTTTIINPRIVDPFKYTSLNADVRRLAEEEGGVNTLEPSWNLAVKWN